MAGVPLVCLSDSRMLFVFVSGKAFVPAFEGEGEQEGRNPVFEGGLVLCILWGGGGSTYSCVSVSDCVKFCVLRGFNPWPVFCCLQSDLLGNGSYKFVAGF